jgi:transcriptional regulatory protein RtcR
MSTLAPGSRIATDIVDEEIRRLQSAWSYSEDSPGDRHLRQLMDEDNLSDLDDFDRSQLVHAIEVCMRSRSLSEAGRMLFNASRKQKAVANDADRLRKYLSRFGLDFKSICELSEP